MKAKTRQLLVLAPGGSVISVDNEDHRDPFDFDRPDQGRTVPRFGSASLLQLARLAAKADFEVVGVAVRDRSLRPLEPEREDRVVSDIIGALRGGQSSEARQALKGPRGPYVVVGLDLVDPNDVDISVHRFGETEGGPDDRLVELLRTVGPQIGLS